MNAKQTYVDKSTHPEIIQNLLEKLKAYYIFPEIAEQISGRLQMYLDVGEYADITDGETLAVAITTHMQEINHDKHLSVWWHPESSSEQEGSMHDDEEWLEDLRQRGKLDNYGIHRLERLPGNIGYIDIRGFSDPDWGGDTASAAMNFLANTHAMIIDITHCPGGSPGMIAFISSYLFEEPVHLNSLYWRDGDVTQQFWTLPYVPGKRYGNKPIYVLLSRNTFSGGEEFAYNLQTRQRATLIGEVTAGGAHPGAEYRIHPNFDAFIPNGRAINPVTGTNWEGTGVTPDISTSQEDAFKKAYEMGLKFVIKTIDDATSESARELKEEAKKVLKGLEAG